MLSHPTSRAAIDLNVAISHAKTFHLCLRWLYLEILGVDVTNEDQLIFPWLHLPDISIERLSDLLESHLNVDQSDMQLELLGRRH